jgi:hypothetical protein
VTRGPLGSAVVDATGLAVGEYLLPTFDYSFVRVVDDDGALVPTSHFDRRPVIHHTGTATRYVVDYNFEPERLAVVAATVVFLISLLFVCQWRRIPRQPPRPSN